MLHNCQCTMAQQTCRRARGPQATPPVIYAAKPTPAANDPAFVVAAHLERCLHQARPISQWKLSGQLVGCLELGEFWEPDRAHRERSSALPHLAVVAPKCYRSDLPPLRVLRISSQTIKFGDIRLGADAEDLPKCCRGYLKIPAARVGSPGGGFGRPSISPSETTAPNVSTESFHPAEVGSVDRETMENRERNPLYFVETLRPQTRYKIRRGQ